MSVARRGVWTGPRPAVVAVGACALVLSLMLVIAPGLASAASELDQKQEVGAGLGLGKAVNSEFSAAQTFKAGKSGTLEKVELNLSQLDLTPTQPLTVEITEVNASGEPDTTKVLGSGSFGPATLPEAEMGGEWVSINVTAPSKAGTSYAIVAFSSAAAGSGYVWDNTTTNPYADGQEWFSFASPPAAWKGEPRVDDTFRTYVAAAATTPPDLSLENSASPSPVLSGNTLTYTVNVTNTGSETANDVKVSDPLPKSAVFGSLSTTQGTCTRTAGTVPKTKNGLVSCKLGSLEGDKTATITIAVTATKPVTLNAKATVTASNVASDNDDEATATTTVLGE